MTVGQDLRRAARREWGPLWSAVRAPLAARGPRAVSLTLASVALTALLQVVQNRPWGYGPVQTLGAVRADDPLRTALLRTPLSLFVPALDLPVWGALAQMLVVFGVAEVCLGRWRTLLIAYAATLAGTLYARTGIAAGPGAFLGLPASDARVVDTGPSAAVVALAVCVCWAHRARVTGAVVIVAMAAEAVLKDNLAGREHLAAIAAALALCAVPALRGRGGQGSEGGSGTRSGAPPIRSWNLRRGPTQRTSWW
ncbi:hypothetical protein ABZ565_01900 [Streptomyces sp. NPDC016469]|uniref:hypothetical protein n=1 Tax=Streptomyces sp. NPDC016469 TaxID=3157191 RepID=UPI0033EA2D28